MTPKRWSAIILAALIGCGGSAPSDSNAQTLPASQGLPASRSLQVNASDSVTASRRTAITRAVARVAPAVVTVQTSTVERVPSDPFEYFFGGRTGQRSSAGMGSGFFVRGDGVLVTNAHVVSGASTISIMTRDGTTWPAELVGEDLTNDLAVLRIKTDNVPTAPLGRSDNLMIGEWAIAIGNPFGFLLGNTEPSVTAGVISATGRNLVGRGEGQGVYVDMIQTDASINPGNSGGPLINADGEVIGVNSSIYSPTGGSVGLGFAIPINRVKRVVEDLLAHGAVRRPWIGVKLDYPSTGNAREALTAGVVLQSVVPGSPAERAGLRPGDRIVRSRGRALQNVYDWEAELLELRVGETIPLDIHRGSRDLTINVEVADLPEVSAAKVEVLREIQLVTLTPAIRAERGVRAARGAVVFSTTDRIAREIGLQAGDVIVQINNAPITNAGDVARVFDNAGRRSPLRIFFEREGRVYATDVILP
jgi:serine protease Do